jgi:hypothetical protein
VVAVVAVAEFPEHEEAVVAVAAFPEQAAAVVALAAFPEHDAAVVAVAEFPEQAAAVVALAAFPVQLPEDPVMLPEGATTLVPMTSPRLLRAVVASVAPVPPLMTAIAVPV